MAGKQQNRYAQMIAAVFDKFYKEGSEEVRFTGDDLIATAAELDIKLPKNVPDVLYSFRYRNAFPESITSRAPEGKHWIIRGAGRGCYVFAAIKEMARILPSEHLIVTKVPDATPEVIRANALNDEQALLALVRYNRLIDIFLGVAAYSLQNHLRTSVKGIGQVEVDEIYVAIDRYGVQHILPVQAKGGSDEIGITQIEQDVALCREKFAELKPRPVAAQFMGNGVIALFELAVQDEAVVVIREGHYQLVPNDEITAEDRALYAQQAQTPPAL